MKCKVGPVGDGGFVRWEDRRWSLRTLLLQIAGCLGEDQAGLCNQDGLNYSLFTRVQACIETETYKRESHFLWQRRNFLLIFPISLVHLHHSACHFLSILPHTDPSPLLLLRVNIRSHFHFLDAWTLFTVSVVVHHVQSPNFAVFWQLTKCPSCQI